MTKELIEHHKGQDETGSNLYLLGVAAMIVCGAGLILSKPSVRRHLGDLGGGLRNILQGAIPDLYRYMKMRSM